MPWEVAGGVAASAINEKRKEVKAAKESEVVKAT